MTKIHKIHWITLKLNWASLKWSDFKLFYMYVNKDHMVTNFNKNWQFLHRNAARLVIKLEKILWSLKYLNLAEFSPKSLFRSWFACWLLRWLLWTESLNTYWEIPPIKGGRIIGVSRSLLPCLVSQFANWGLYGKNYLGIGKEELIKLPLIGFPGTNPCKIHRKIPWKMPLRLNLTPLVTITYLDFAKWAPGWWICLP